MKRAYSYKDVYLVPSKTIVDTRKMCDTSVTLGKMKFDMPVYPSNMKSVVNLETCLFLAKNNYFYTMHRFGIKLKDVLDFCKDNDIFSSVSVGINDDSYEDLNSIKGKYNPDYITLDVANAYSEKSFKMIRYIQKNFPNSFLIIGNIATEQAVLAILDVLDSHAALKVGIAGGSVCITKNKTGFHVPMATCVKECSSIIEKEINTISLIAGNDDEIYNSMLNRKYLLSIPIIADGGIEEHGDVAKAIALGAHMVMAGSLFSGYNQSAGDIVNINNHLYKEYYGSASEHNKGEYKNVEGTKKLVEYKGDMSRLLIELKEDLQSSISYAGGSDLSALKHCKIISTT